MRLTGKDTTVNETPLKMSHFGAKLMCFHFSEIWTFAAKKYFLNYSFLFISQNCSLSCLKNNHFFSPIIMILRYTAFYFQAHFSPRIKNSRKRMNSKLSSDIFRFLIPIRSNPEKKEKQQQNFWHFNIPRSSPMG